MFSISMGGPERRTLTLDTERDGFECHGRIHQQAGDPRRAQAFLQKAQQLEERSRVYHNDILEHENLSGDNLAQRPEG